MKEKLLFAALLCALSALGSALILDLPGSPPTVDRIAAVTLRQGEAAGVQRLAGYDRSALYDLWGFPDVMFSGLWADIWYTGDGGGLYVGYAGHGPGRVDHLEIKAPSALSRGIEGLRPASPQAVAKEDRPAS